MKAGTYYAASIFSSISLGVFITLAVLTAYGAIGGEYTIERIEYPEYNPLINQEPPEPITTTETGNRKPLQISLLGLALIINLILTYFCVTKFSQAIGKHHTGALQDKTKSDLQRASNPGKGREAKTVSPANTVKE